VSAYTSDVALTMPGEDSSLSNLLQSAIVKRVDKAKGDQAPNDSQTKGIKSQPSFVTDKCP